MKKPTRRSCIRVGDSVRIVNPQVFVRCGYPLGVNDALLALEADPELLHKVLALSPSERAQKLILRALASDWLIERKWGGNERSIHTALDESLRGQCACVTELKTRYTGHRHSGYADSYWDESEPPGFTCAKAHRIATLTFTWSQEPVTELVGVAGDKEVQIETCHLEPSHISLVHQ